MPPREIIEEAKRISLPTLLSLVGVICSVLGGSIVTLGSALLVSQKEFALHNLEFANYKREAAEIQQRVAADSIKRDTEAVIQLERLSQQVAATNTQINQMLSDNRNSDARDEQYQSFIKSRLDQVTGIVENRLQPQRR